ncbi:MAG: multicopper oxidase family protein [Planctomycetes bacterium]|nr:multicopper oxidase family protein [Planctomycetota bacterium]
MPTVASARLDALLLLGLGSLFAATARAQIVETTITARPGVATLAPGVTANAWLYNGTLPGPTLRVTEGQRLRVRFVNELPESSIIHVHGQPVHQGMDGQASISRPETAAGQEFLYDFEGLKPGTYWYHPHSEHHEQLDKGLYGALIVEPANTAGEPAFDYERAIVLDEWTNPLGGTGFTGHLVNGNASGGSYTIPATNGRRLRLRFANASARTSYVVALDGHLMEVTHADGYRVRPVTTSAFVIGVGERYDVIVNCNNPGVWSLAVSTFQNRAATVVRGIVRYQGQSGPDPAATYVPPALSGGTLLDYSQLASDVPVAPIAANPARRFSAVLGMTMGPSGQLWTINGQAWPNVTPWQVSQGEIVEITWTNTTMSPMHMHPMHLHGHSFRIVGTAGGTSAPPTKDVVLLRPAGQPGSTLTIQFTADNPGKWLAHCHDMMHMAQGMMTSIDYTGDADGDGLADSADHDPTKAQPVLLIADDAAQFQIGQVGALGFQWQPQSIATLYVALSTLPAPVLLAPLGELELDPLGMWAIASFGLGGASYASLPYAIPSDPLLQNGRFVLQALATTTLPGSARFSNPQAFTIR